MKTQYKCKICNNQCLEFYTCSNCESTICYKCLEWPLNCNLCKKRLCNCCAKMKTIITDEDVDLLEYCDDCNKK